MWRRWIVLFIMGLVWAMLLVSPPVSAQTGINNRGCEITSFTMAPEGDVVQGRDVFLGGTSTCGTVRFEVDGHPRAETGQRGQTETLHTNEFGLNGHDVCFVARGEGGWENAARKCKWLYVKENSPNYQEWRPDFSQARQSSPVGGVDIITVCYAYGYSSAGNSDETLMGNYCANNNGIWYIDWTRVCADVYGPNFVPSPVGQGKWDQRCLETRILPPTAMPTPQPLATLPPPRTPVATTSPSGQPNSTLCRRIAMVATGHQARVIHSPSFDPLNFRSAAGTGETTIMFTLHEGDILTVTGPSTCRDGYRWWPVFFNGFTGWVADGDTSRYWLEDAGELETVG